MTVPAIVWGQVVAFDAGLASVPLEIQLDILAHVNTLNPKGFGGELSPKYKLARLYLAAHLGTVWKIAQTAGAGAVSSETISASSITISYDTTKAAEDLTLTAHGEAYEELAKSSLSRLPFVPSRGGC